MIVSALAARPIRQSTLLLDDPVQVERVAEMVCSGELEDRSGCFGFAVAEGVGAGREPVVQAFVDVDVDAVAGHRVIFRASRLADARVRTAAVPTMV